MKARVQTPFVVSLMDGPLVFVTLFRLNAGLLPVRGWKNLIIIRDGLGRGEEDLYLGGVCWEVNLVLVLCLLRADRRRIHCLIVWIFYSVLSIAVCSSSRLISCMYVYPFSRDDS